jgi:hypothetical protein
MLHPVKAHSRNSPIAHKVKSHKRDGYTVHSYTRGSGKPHKKSPFKPTGSIQGRPINHKNANSVFPEVKAWTVNFKYREGNLLNNEQGESVMVFSRSYHNALDEAYEDRKYKHRQPIAVDIVDPDLGSMVSFLREKAHSPMVMKIGKATSLGAKYAVEAKTKIADSTAGRKIRGKIFSNAGKALSKRGGFFGGLLGEHLEGKSKDISEALEDKNAQKYLKMAWSEDPKERAVARAFLKRNHPEIYAAADFSRGTNVTTSKVVHIHKYEREQKGDNIPELRKLADKPLPNQNPELEKLKAEKAKMIAGRTADEHAKYVAEVVGKTRKHLDENKDKENKRSRADKRDENK